MTAFKYSYPLVFLPVVIDKIGFYLTRCDELVEITKMPTKENPDCEGTFYENYAPTKFNDTWKNTGEYYSGRSSDHDMIAFVQFKKQ